MEKSDLYACAMVTVAALLIAAAAVKSKRKRRSVWVKGWLQRRRTSGAYSCLLPELASTDESALRNFLRMDADTFRDLAQLVEADVQKKNTVMRQAISVGERLAVTLRFLATGE
jgi:hypothetical protein